MAHLRKKPEIEPLSADRWERIEEELFDKLDAPAQKAPRASVRPRVRAAWPLVLAGAAAAAAAALVWHATVPAPATDLGPSRFATHGDTSHVDLNGASLDVSPESVVVVSGDDERGMLLVLDRGSVTCDVAPRHGRAPFVVQAGEVRVRVVGTHFTVRREGDSASVEVERGTVEVSAHGEIALVTQGESWPSAHAVAPRAPAPDPSGPAEPAPAAASADGPTASASARPSPARAKPQTSQELYESAMEMEVRRPDQAMAIYRDLARGEGPWAANGLYAAGRLEADRGHRAEARALLNDYLLRFPRGTNAEDARQLLKRLL